MKKFSSSGFSLVELMVGGAILAGIGLTGATLMKNQKMAQSRIDHDLELDLLHTKISDIFTENAKDCDATFRGKYGSTNLSAITEIKRCVDGCNPERDASSVNASTALTVFRTGANNTQELGDRNLWYIESFGALTPHGGGTTSRTNLVVMPVNYAHKLTNRRITKFVTIAMRFDRNGNFLQCVDGSTSNIQNLEREMCKTIKQVSTNGTIIRGVWNGDTQKCIVSTGGNVCPSGTSYVGIPGSGNSSSSCRSTTQVIQTQFKAGQPTSGVQGWIHPQASASCVLLSTGYKMTVRLSRAAGNRVSIVCQ